MTTPKIEFRDETSVAPVTEESVSPAMTPAERLDWAHKLARLERAERSIGLLPMARIYKTSQPGK